MEYTVITGDCLDTMRGMDDDSVDAIVTDPPAGIAFMGKAWDGDKGGRRQWIAWLSEVMSEAMRVIKPGGHALVWALPRTSHWTGAALEDAGWEIRDVFVHIFGSGMPKSFNLRNVPGMPEKWHGWGSAAKPSQEMWYLARKPLAGTIAANVVEHGTGALNVDGCRVATDDKPRGSGNSLGYHGGGTGGNETSDLGRWPPNLLLTHAIECNATGRCVPWCPVAEMDRQSGQSCHVRQGGRKAGIWESGDIDGGGINAPGDSGGASRFFPRFRYNAKPSTAEKDAGLDSRALVVNLTWHRQTKGEPWDESNTTHEVRKAVLRVGTGTLAPRVIGVSGVENKSASEWSMFLFGKASMDRYQKVSRSTTSTATSLTTPSGILRYLTHLLTNDCTAAANFAAACGGNLAALAVSCSTFRPTTTNERTASRPNVKSVLGPVLVEVTREGRGNTHSTVKSIALMRWLVRLITPPGGVVLDPFCGSGTTGIACVEEGISFIGCEQSPEFADIARARIAHHNTQGRLF